MMTASRRTFPRFGFMALVVWGLSVSAPMSASAAPLELKHVPADARWLIHVDVDAVRQSTVVQRLHQKIIERHPHAQHMGNVVNQLTGCDPRHDLYGITIFGQALVPDRGVMLMHVKHDTQKVRNWLNTLVAVETVKVGNRDVYSFTHEHHGRRRPVVVTWVDDLHLLASSSVDEAKWALAVIDGQAACVAPEAPMAGHIPPGTTVLLRAIGINEAKLPHRDPIAEQTCTYRFVMGEYQGQSFFRSRSVMTNQAVVGQVTRMLDGLKALGEVHVGNNPDGKKITEGLRVKAEEQTVTVLWSAPADSVWKMIELHGKIVDEFRARHRHGHHHPGHGPDPGKQPNRPGVAPENDF